MNPDPSESCVSCASLAMYDWPEVADATDQLWTHLSAVLSQAGLSVPRQLDRGRALDDIWLDSGLVLAQTCGYPYLSRLQHATTLLGTPDYAVDGAANGYYQSLLLTHASTAKTQLEDFAGTRLAINDINSQSGFNAVRLQLAQNLTSAPSGNRSRHNATPPWFFNRTLATGSHRASLRAVASQHADLCAVDPVSLALARHYDTEVVEQLRVIGRTPRVPALPLICSNRVATQFDVDLLQQALRTCIEELPEEIRQTLHLRSLRPLGDDDYEPLRRATRSACRSGYEKLAANHEPTAVL